MLGKSLFGNLAPICSVIWRENHNGTIKVFATFICKICCKNFDCDLEE